MHFLPLHCPHCQSWQLLMLKSTWAIKCPYTCTNGAPDEEAHGQDKRKFLQMSCPHKWFVVGGIIFSNHWSGLFYQSSFYLHTYCQIFEKIIAVGLGGGQYLPLLYGMCLLEFCCLCVSQYMYMQLLATSTIKISESGYTRNTCVFLNESWSGLDLVLLLLHVYAAVSSSSWWVDRNKK